MRLQLSGYRVICAEDGEQALEMFHNESPDLVVLDVMLAQAGRLRGLPPSTRGILCANHLPLRC